MQSEVELRRLHPLSLLFSLGSAAKGLILPGLFVLFAARGGSYDLWLMILFVPAVLASTIKYWTYRYRLGHDEMVIREGVLTRNERHIPYSRIQNIDLVQNPLHRIFGVALVRLETGSGGKPEAVIRVLSLPAVEEMRARVFQEQRTDPTPAETQAPQPEERPLHTLALRDLVALGLISNRGMAVVAAMMGLAWQTGIFDDLEERLSSLDGSTFEGPGRLALDSPVRTLLAALALLLVFLILLRLLSVGWSIAKFHGFRLRGHGEDLQAQYGLLTRVSASVPRHRIQLLATRQTFLHRRLGRTSIQIETAGGGTGEAGVAGASTEKLWLAPVIAVDRASELIREALPGIDPDRADWTPLASGARLRVFKRALLVAGLVSVVALVWLRWWGLLVPMVAAPLAWLHAGLYVKHTAYAVMPGAVLFRSGWWHRRMSVVRFNKVQTLNLDRSPFDRRHRMGLVRLDTAGAGRTGHPIAIPYLDHAVARGIVERLYGEASRTAYRW